MDIQQELDRAIGHGPALPAPEQRQVAGRAALRRRRVLVGTSAAAVLMGTIAPLALGGGPATRGTDPAPAAPPGTTSPGPDGVDIFRENIRLARFEADGRLWIHPGTVVHERRDDVLPGAVWSVALDATYDGRRSWLLFQQVDGASANGIYSGPGDDPKLYGTFDEFVVEGVSALSRSAPGLTDSPSGPSTAEGES